MVGRQIAELEEYIEQVASHRTMAEGGDPWKVIFLKGSARLEFQMPSEVVGRMLDLVVESCKARLRELGQRLIGD